MKLLGSLCLLLILSSCGLDKVSKFASGVKKGPSLNTVSAPTNFRLLVTDAPFNYGLVESVLIKFEKIQARVHEGSFEAITKEAKVVDLVPLQNGNFDILADLQLPLGHYIEFKFFISEAKVKLQGGQEFQVSVPKQAAEGVVLPLEGGVLVADSEQTQLLLDVNLAQSFLPKGDPLQKDEGGGFDFFPVMHLINVKEAGALVGVVINDQHAPVKGAVVGAKKDGKTWSAITSENGTFAIIGLPAGSYEVQAQWQERKSLKNQTTIEVGSPAQVGPLLLFPETNGSI